MPKATQNLGHDYSAAWSSKSAAAVASFYSADGQIIINGGEPMSGHKAIAEMAAGFYAAFPDLIVRCDDFRVAGKHALFLWTLEGHHAETKSFVKVGGWEEWDLDDRSKVKASLGWFDTVDYEDQIAGRTRPS